MNFPVGFEWAENKNATNKQKHGIFFDASIGIFNDYTVEKEILH